MSHHWRSPIPFAVVLALIGSTSCQPQHSSDAASSPDTSIEPAVIQQASTRQSEVGDRPTSSPSPGDRLSESTDSLGEEPSHEHSAVVYARHERPSSIIHTVTISPSSSVEIGVAVADDGLATVEQQAESVEAIAAINAGFFDPNNQQTTSHVIIDGEHGADPRDNDRLISNPNLAPYLAAILNRSEFRRLICDGQVVFNIAFHQESLPNSTCVLQDAVGGGPQLLPVLRSVEEGFLAYGDDGQVIRDAIGSLSPNARSAIGITETGAIVFAMAAQHPEVGDGTGLSLPDLADFLASIGVQSALNLDGGSSSGLFVEGTVYYGRFDPEGTPIERPVQSIVFVRPRASSQ